VHRGAEDERLEQLVHAGPARRLGEAVAQRGDLIPREEGAQEDAQRTRRSAREDAMPIRGKRARGWRGVGHFEEEQVDHAAEHAPKDGEQHHEAGGAVEEGREHLERSIA
jgi:hypothetical protein